ITDPVVKPLRTFIPSWRAIDFATLVASLVLQLVMISLITLMLGGPIFHSIFLAWSFVGLLSTLIDIYFFALIIMIIASWIAPYNNHPALMLIYQITEPLCRPARRLIPPMGGLDFSVMIVILALILFDQYLVIRPLAEALGMPKGLILGL
ncbi:MAG: YggT family protein, partial [Gammaproteobacteria bacterium]|nr:YggT family protein [Gammaproteobacteria bacterium]